MSPKAKKTAKKHKNRLITGEFRQQNLLKVSICGKYYFVLGQFLSKVTSRFNKFPPQGTDDHPDKARIRGRAAKISLRKFSKNSATWKLPCSRCIVVDKSSLDKGKPSACCDLIYNFTMNDPRSTTVAEMLVFSKSNLNICKQDTALVSHCHCLKTHFQESETWKVEPKYDN